MATANQIIARGVSVSCKPKLGEKGLGSHRVNIRSSLLWIKILSHPAPQRLQWGICTVSGTLRHILVPFTCVHANKLIKLESCLISDLAAITTVVLSHLLSCILEYSILGSTSHVLFRESQEELIS